VTGRADTGVGHGLHARSGGRNLARQMTDNLIYHVCRHDEWQVAAARGIYDGSSQDRADGFIHFSARDQIVESVARHRAGQDGLVLLAVDPVALGPALKWEPSRDGRLFPHLYGGLPLSAVIWVRNLPLAPGGLHIFPVLD
jgi:uncharacterized protein (DUF952 family)